MENVIDCEAEVRQVFDCGGDSSCKIRSERALMWCVFSSVCPAESRDLQKCFDGDSLEQFTLDKSPSWKCRRAYRSFDKCLTAYDPLANDVYKK